ncbi:MAG: potassium channel family protein [Nitrospiria bacterium]
MLQNKIARLTLLTIFILFFGAVGLSYFENIPSLVDAIWWSFVTITTVGYGDVTPTTLGGRITGVIVMVFGIGILGMFTATVASIFVEGKLSEGKGKKGVKVKGHFLICGWNYKVAEIVEEMRADRKAKDKSIVLIADLAEKPLDDPYTFFISGEVNVETLKKANLSEASAVLITSDDQLDSYARDAKVVFNTLTIRTVREDIYICAEISDAKNMKHCKMAGANEIIVIGELSSNLLVQAALDHGITQIISELVSNRFGNGLYKIKPPEHLVGKTFIEVLSILKDEKNAIPVAIASNGSDRLLSNPPREYTIQSDDVLVIISEGRPHF